MITKIIPEEQIENARDLIYDAERIVIVSHTRPDGDAIGSSLAMYHFLQKIDKEPLVILPDEYPTTFSWLPNTDKIIIHKKNPEIANAAINGADLIICLDFNHFKRTASLSEILNQSPTQKILIDHHIDPAQNCWNIVISQPKMVATCEVVFRLICRMGHASEIDSNVATCLYTGLMTDTGNFSYNSNNIELYYIIAELLKRGIDKDQIYDNVNNNCSINSKRLYAYLLHKKLELYPKQHAAIISMTKEEAERFNLQRGDTEGLVNEPLSIAGISCSVFVSEDKEKVKLSWRSRGDFAVNEICSKYFNGGGHKNASGGEVFGGNINEILEQVRTILKNK